MHTLHPLLHKTPQEKRKIESTLKKYFKVDAKQTEQDKKLAAMFGKKQNITKVTAVSDDSTASSDNEDLYQSLYFTVEEIEVMNDSDKLIYMNKLSHDSKIISDKLTEVIDIVKKARKECTAAIEGGNETLKMYADYQARMEKLVGKAMGNLGCHKEQESFCGMGK